MAFHSIQFPEDPYHRYQILPYLEVWIEGYMCEISALQIILAVYKKLNRQD